MTSENMFEAAENALQAIDDFFDTLVDAAHTWSGSVELNAFVRTGPALVNHAREVPHV